MTIERKRLSAKSRSTYVEGMKRYQEQGVRILIDGKEPDDELWEKLFEIRNDHGFYMGDYIWEEIPQAAVDTGAFAETAILKETDSHYRVKNRLKEIRFDLVHHR